MCRVITSYRWFTLDDSFNLVPPKSRFDTDLCIWTNLTVYNSEIDAHNALQEFVGECTWEEYVLIKTYKLASKY